MKRNVLIIAIVVIVLLGVGGFFGWQRLNASAATTQRTPTTTVTRGSLVATVSAAGNVSAVKSATIGFQTAGRVSVVNVQVGDRVKTGQLLMQIDLSDQQLALRDAQAQLASAQATFENAKAKNAQNPQQLLVNKAALDKAIAALQTAQADYNAVAWRNDITSNQRAAALANATADYQSALANFNITAATINDTALRTATAALEQAQIAVEQAQRALEKGKIYAPFDGYISTVNFNVGDSAGTGAAVALADVSTLQVKVTLAEVDVAKVKVGQPAQMTLDALSGSTFTAQVTAIGPVAAISQGVVNYPVIVSVSNPDAAIRPGMTANLAIEVDRRDNVLLIPTRAIRTQGNQRLVNVLYKGQNFQVPIQTGLSSDTQIEIISGLQEGDEVAVQQTTTRQTGGFGGPGGGPGFIGR